MKKLFLTLSLASMMFVAAAQKIVITGAMFDPQGSDAPATTDPDNGNHANLGGYEYIQLMATENIDFSLTNYCVVRCINTGAANGAESTGWAATGLARTFKFNLTSGTVSKGEFFYVGGPEKTAGGFLVESSIYYPVLNMNASKWIRVIPYSNGTVTNVGDDNIGIGNTGLFPNSVAGTAANPIGMAVFLGTSIDGNSVPIDVVFTGYRTPITSWASVYKDNGGGNINGYRVPNTDRLAAGYYGDSDQNKFAFLFQPSTNVGWFLKLSGVFDDINGGWATPRTANYVQLVPPTGTAAERTSFASLAMLEGNTAGYGGTQIAATTFSSILLPVSLTNFTAKANKQGTVNLAWATAAEQNNSHFEVARSVDGQSFTKIGEVLGAGSSNAANHYNFTDESPISGVNYYRLKQIDKDGKSTLSSSVSVKLGLSQNQVSASLAENGASVKVNYNAQVAGTATFTIYNLSGVKLASLTHAVKLGSNQLTIPVQLKKSVYLLQVQQGGVVTSIKF
jgi:hypothetical protein